MKYIKIVELSVVEEVSTLHPLYHDYWIIVQLRLIKETPALTIKLFEVQGLMPDLLHERKTTTLTSDSITIDEMSINA